MHLRAGIHPTGSWSEPCDVICPCGFRQQVSTCPEAQRVAAEHDAEHERGDLTQQLALFPKRRG